MGLSVANKYLLNRFMGKLSNAVGLGDSIACPGITGYLEAIGTLTQAQLISMFTTPISLIAAPGAGLLNVVDEVEFFHDFTTTAYTGGGDVTLLYAGQATIVDVDVTLITTGSDTNRLIKPSAYDLDASTGTGLGFSLAANANKAIQITNATAVFAAGNVANILKYRIVYHTIALLS